jgi:hypothetical protein
LFDFKVLPGSEGITDNIRKSFIIYFISHSSPLVEVFNPGLHDIKRLFENEFSGMPIIYVTLDELPDVGENLLMQLKLL